MSGKIDMQQRALNNSNCSCKECDSMVCFKKRRQSTELCTCKKCESGVCLKNRHQTIGICSCDKCDDSKTCFFYTNKMVDLDESKSDMLRVQPKDIVGSNKIDSMEKSKSNVSAKEKSKCAKELFEKEIIYDNNKSTELTVQKHSKYFNVDLQEPCGNKIGDSSQLGNISEKPFSKVSVDKTVSSNKTEKPYSKQLINNTASFNKTEKLYSKVSENTTDNISKSQEKSDFTISVNEIDEIVRKSEITNSKKKIIPSSEFEKLSKSHKNKSSKVDKLKNYTDGTCPLVNNVAFNYSQAGRESFAAKLSAQIMDVPYSDYKNTVSSHKSENSTKATKLTKLDILNRIKEAYKACSCKVCECIASIPCPVTAPRENMCKCKPCECDDCRQLIEDLTGSSKNGADIVSNFCICEPCNCIDCKMMSIHRNRTIIVAPVGEENQRRICQCSPCGCLECGNVFGTIATSITHEISTGVNRHRNCRCDACLNEACDQDVTDTCRCEERGKVMRKPVQKDTHDYDIRSAIVSNKNPLTRGEDINPIGHDTIAMFASLTNSFFRPVQARAHNDSCSCDDCECLVCKKNNAIPPILKNSQNFGALKKVDKSLNILDACKCLPCECQICKQNRKCFETDERENFCRCKVCDCINCASTIPSCTKAHVINRSINKFPSQGICDCVPCECLDCQKMRYKCTGDPIRQQYSENIYKEKAHPNKEGEVLKVSVSETSVSDRYINHILHTNSNRSKNCSARKSIHSHSSNNSKPDVFIYQTYPSYINKSIRHSGRGELLDQVDKECRFTISNTKIKCDTNSGYNNDRKTTYYLKNETGNMECQVSETYISAVSSCATTSYIVHESGSMTPISRKQTTRSSWQSSCNSSGHDHSDYLIRFPRTPAETCINEVMKLNLDRKLNFNRINVLPKTNDETNCIKLSKTFMNGPNGNESYCTKHFTERNGDYFKTIDYKMCKNVDLPKSCNCNPCDCDRCSFNKLKFKRCKCDCIACNCYGACLSEDHSICIRKNEGTQTRLKFYQDRGQDSLESEQINREFSKLHPDPLSPHTKDDGLSRNEDVFLPSRYCPYNFICRSEDSYIRNNVDFLSIPIHINYESVQDTLREARAFSLELLQILEKYEKANREFESVSQKFKHSHETFLESNISSKRNDIDTYLKVSNAETGNTIRHEKKPTAYEHGERNKILIQNSELKKEQDNSLVVNKDISDVNKLSDKILIADKHNSTVSLPDLQITDKDIRLYNAVKEDKIKHEKQSSVNKNLKTNQFSIEHIEQMNGEQKKSIIVNKKVTDVDNQLKNAYTSELNLTPIIKSCNDLSDSLSTTQSVGKTEVVTLSSYIIEEVYKQIFNERQELKLKNRYKKYRKLIKRAIRSAKKIDFNNENHLVTSGTTTSENESTQVIEDEQKFMAEGKDAENSIRAIAQKEDTKESKLIEDMRKSGIVCESTTNSTSESFKRLEERTIKYNSKKFDTNSIYVNNEKSYDVQGQEQTQENGNFYVLKNLRLNAKAINNTKGLSSKLPILERDLKDTIESKPTQGKTIEAPVPKLCYRNNALTNMRVRLKTQLPKLDDTVGGENKPHDESSVHATKKQDLELKDTSDVTSSQKSFIVEDIIKTYKKATSSQEVHSTTTINTLKKQHQQAKDLPNFSSLKLTTGKICSKSTDNTTVNAEKKNLQAIASANNNDVSSDAMKISFKGVRRVSDHTILVKWNPPRSTKDIEGYELLVDGRAVQKVLSPTRCMAVVTCLPQTEKVLLTIRMLTAAGRTDHYPSTTIVYRPRAK